LVLTFVETAILSAITKFVMPVLAAVLFLAFLPFGVLVALVSALPKLLTPSESMSS
jgi:hypothetical protein